LHFDSGGFVVDRLDFFGDWREPSETEAHGGTFDGMNPHPCLHKRSYSRDIRRPQGKTCRTSAVPTRTFLSVLLLLTSVTMIDGWFGLGKKSPRKDDATAASGNVKIIGCLPADGAKSLSNVRLAM